MTTATDALERLRAAADSGALGELCREHDVELLVAFGSATDPDTAPDAHDLDVAVRLGSDGDLVAVANALIDATGFSHVDVMDLSRASVVARARALGPPGLPLHEHQRGAFALAQMAALTEAMETAHLRRLDLELLAER